MALMRSGRYSPGFPGLELKDGFWAIGGGAGRGAGCTGAGFGAGAGRTETTGAAGCVTASRAPRSMTGPAFALVAAAF
jgi:hypothetical protein